MNPYHELHLKYLKKEISAKLYQKSFNLLRELEKKDLEKRKQLEENRKQKKNTQIKTKNQKELQKRQAQLQKQREKALKIKEAKEKHLKKVKEYRDLLENPEKAKEKQKEILFKLSKMNQLQKLEYLGQLETVKEFNSEHHYSKKVVLLEGLIVRKQCQLDSFGNYMFKNEIKSLQKLTPYPHFPILVAFDPYNLVIYMTYCGPTLNSSNIPRNWREQFEEISQILEVLDVNSNDMLLRNTCVFNGEISVIDFGLDTQFGRDLKTVLREFYLKLNSITNPKQKIKENTEELQTNLAYQKDYHGWKRRLQQTKELKMYLELEVQKARMKKSSKRHI